MENTGWTLLVMPLSMLFCYLSAFLSCKKLVDYADWKDEYSTPKKSPPKNFYLACTAAEKLFEQSSDHKVRFLSQIEES